MKKSHFSTVNSGLGIAFKFNIGTLILDIPLFMRFPANALLSALDIFMSWIIVAGYSISFILVS